MNILVAPDKFKGSLSAPEVAEAICRGIASVSDDIKVNCLPLADGGEGTAEILTSANNGFMIGLTVTGPLGKPVTANYGISGSGDTAFIEMSEASGLKKIMGSNFSCYHTTTIGTGELILDAYNRNVKKLILGIGGSATNDAGMGMAKALGIRFFDNKGKELDPIGKNLIGISRIDFSARLIPENKLTVIVASDVKNPLYGPNGAAFIYAQQKGASQQEIKLLDRGLKNFSSVIANQCGIDVSEIPGAGAAGGLGAGAVAFLNASLESGIEMVFRYTDFDEALKRTNLVVTGEGSLDLQSMEGKVISGILHKTKQAGIPIALLCGSIDSRVRDNIPDHVIHTDSVIIHADNLKDSMVNASHYLENMAANMFGKITSKE